MDSAFLDLVGAVIKGDVDDVSRRLTADPALATAVRGAGKREASDAFFPEIAHYLYAGDTALHMAAAAFHVPMAERLVAHGADCRAKNRRGAEPLHYAADANRWRPIEQAAMIDYLASIGADPNALDRSGVAPLHRAVRTRSLATVRALVQAGADPMQPNGTGSTPLHLAVQTTGRGGSGSEQARQEQAGIIRFLLERGARPSDEDRHGKSVALAATSEWIRILLKEAVYNGTVACAGSILVNNPRMRSVQTEMSTAPITPAKPLRLWPGVAIVLVQWLARFVVPIFDPSLTPYGVMVGVAAWVALVVWWLFFSRAPWSDRLGGVAVMVIAIAATWPLLDVSLATGAMGFIFPILAMPGLCLAFVLAAVVSRHLSPGARRATMVAAIVVSCAVWTLVRTGGFSGNFENDLDWRWAATPEQRLLARGEEPAEAPASAAPSPATSSNPAPREAAVPAATPAVPAARQHAAAGAVVSHPALAPAAAGTHPALDWSGFRGRDRDGVVRGARIDTDWSASPPAELWRRPIGPGWSSVAVHGDLLYTQEQRGEEEIVAAYRVSTGAPVWKHRDQARFWESNGGAGPRGTPTLSNGRVYAFGATGILNALDAADGRVVWSRNVSADSQRRVPDWGFSSSPLLVGDLVVIAAEGKLMAYDLATGAPRWSGPEGGLGYSSPHLVTLDGVPQILLLNGFGATSVAPADGRLLWERQWSAGGASAPIVQPALTSDGDVLIGDGQASGIRRVALAHDASGWAINERWISTGLKPLFNDFVVHEGHAFGFDGSILACIDLADGKRSWKGGRYGAGQLVLLPEQDLLLVLSEEGEVALVAAATDRFTEVARFKAIEGKTWNHPVLVGDILLVRNGEEMAAFRVPLAAATTR